MRQKRLYQTVIIVVIFILASAATLSARVKNIKTEEAYKLIEQRDGDGDFVILDVRTHEEFSEGHIENAVNIDFYNDAFPDELDTLDKDTTYLIYCRSGSRSGRTRNIMKKLGFKNVFNMEGGIIGWQDSYPVVR
jgi:rhodanese-related sulfurtransferase